MMKPRNRLVPLILLLLLGACATYYYFGTQDALPEYITFSNGRIEAQSIDVATRSGGRVLSMGTEEGAMVKAGETLATLDMNHLAAALQGAEANTRAALRQEEEAAAGVAQARSSLDLARKEYTRTGRLVREGAVSKSRNDQSLNQKQLAEAALKAAKERLAAAREAVAAAKAEIARQQDLFSDKDIKAPKDGRVLYKLAEPGEVLPAGGKLVTLLDLTDVYMTIFLPTDTVGKLTLGDEARILLDALPEQPIPAYISYISPEAQFTPRQVETRTEREKMTFRVKVRIPAERLAEHPDSVKTGLPGLAYVRTSSDAAWPAFLTLSTPPENSGKE